MELLRKILFQGQIPYMPVIKRVLFWFAIFVPLLVFLSPPSFPEFVSYGWNVLIGVLALRPLADIFPDLRVLRTLVVLRREFGIFSGLMIVAHFIGFLISTGTPITAVFTDGQFWTWNNFLFWGLLGLFAAIPALVTSNTFSIIRLKRWWKTVQHLAYLFFFFGGMHLFFIGDNSGLFAVLVVGISWLLARFGVKIRFFKPPAFPPTPPPTPPSLTPPPAPPIS